MDAATAGRASRPGQAVRCAPRSTSACRARDRSAPVTLSVGERRFALVANTRDAWAADAPSDRAIVAALRSGRSMSIEALAPGGAPFADVYLLAGAATAIDAAGLGCVGR